MVTTGGQEGSHNPGRSSFIFACLAPSPTHCTLGSKGRMGSGQAPSSPTQPRAPSLMSGHTGDVGTQASECGGGPHQRQAGALHLGLLPEGGQGALGSVLLRLREVPWSPVQKRAPSELPVRGLSIGWLLYILESVLCPTVPAHVEARVSSLHLGNSPTPGQCQAEPRSGPRLSSRHSCSGHPHWGGVSLCPQHLRDVTGQGSPLPTLRTLPSPGLSRHTAVTRHPMDLQMSPPRGDPGAAELSQQQVCELFGNWNCFT